MKDRVILRTEELCLKVVHHITKLNRLQRFENIRGRYAFVLLGLSDIVCAKWGRNKIIKIEKTRQRGIFLSKKRNRTYVAATYKKYQQSNETTKSNTTKNGNKTHPSY